jgi:hypothetical protein
MPKTFNRTSDMDFIAQLGQMERQNTLVNRIIFQNKDAKRLIIDMTAILRHILVLIIHCDKP